MSLPTTVVAEIRRLAAAASEPFYLYDREAIVRHCQAFTCIEYEDKAIHFASMANSSPAFLRLVREAGLKIFVNSPGHLQLAQDLGFAGADIVYTASAMSVKQMRAAHEAGAIINLDSRAQLELYRQLFGRAPVGLRCNIGDRVGARFTRAGYFLGKASRLGLDLDDLEALSGAADIAGLHLYLGTDLLDLEYFETCYRELARLARWFPDLTYLDFGGGFGLPSGANGGFPFADYGRFVSDLMNELCRDLGRSIRLLIEPGRIIGGEAGYFVCRVTDVKQRNGQQLVGVNASSAQFPRPLFYPDDCVHPLTLLGSDTGTTPVVSSVYGCSTYSRDYLARDIDVPPAQVGDLLVFGHAGSYCASAHTRFLGFAPPAEFFM